MSATADRYCDTYSKGLRTERSVIGGIIADNGYANEGFWLKRGRGLYLCEAAAEMLIASRC